MSRVLNLILLLSLTSSLQGQVKEFPYKARVVVSEAWVRSGAGDAFYPTQTLKKDAEITVRRHDPGGWFMIDPPEGSFSWIPEKYVRQLSSTKGEVIENNAVVFVGSSFGDETHVWQRRLTAGDSVRIVDRREVDTQSGPKIMLKIKPPSREYRWIPGAHVIPVDAKHKSDHDTNPYNVPSNIVERQNRTKVNPPPENESVSRYSPSHRLARLQQIRQEQRQLREIDLRFRRMILSEPSNWDLPSIESDYRELQENATYKPVAGQIDLRYPAIRRYEKRKAQLDELDRLTSATEKRDAELLSRQYAFGNGVVTAGSFDNYGGTAGESSELLGEGSFSATFEGSSGEEFSANILPQEHSDLPPLAGPGGSFPLDASGTSGAGGRVFSADGPESPLLPIPNSTSSAQNGPVIPPGSRYIGAGYLIRGTGEDPSEYLLATKSGRVLAHLKPENSVDLESRIGQAVGLHGKRYYDDTIKSDRIEVSGLEPVRLR